MIEGNQSTYSAYFLLTTIAKYQSVVKIKSTLQDLFTSLPQESLGHIGDPLTEPADGLAPLLVVRSACVRVLTSSRLQLTRAKDAGRFRRSSFFPDLHSGVGGFVGNSILVLGFKQ